MSEGMPSEFQVCKLGLASPDEDMVFVALSSADASHTLSPIAVRADHAATEIFAVLRTGDAAVLTVINVSSFTPFSFTTRFSP